MNKGITEGRRRISSSSSAIKNEESLDIILKKKIRLVVIFSVMMAAFLISFLPYAIGRLLYDTGMLGGLSVTDQFILLSICHIAFKSSSLFNPILTLTLKEDYKKGFSKYFKNISQYSVKRFFAKTPLLFAQGVEEIV